MRQLFTATTAYSGPYRVLVGEGSVYAPTSGLCLSAQSCLVAIESGKYMGRLPVGIARMCAEQLFAQAYVGEMRDSWRSNREAWEELLRQPRAVLVCSCACAAACHRGLLAKLVLRAVRCKECRGRKEPCSLCSRNNKYAGEISSYAEQGGLYC